MPIIGSNFPVWREFFEPLGCMKFVDPTKPEDIAKAIQWLLKNPDEAEKMGEKGYQAVLTKYKSKWFRIFSIFQFFICENSSHISEKKYHKK